MSLAQTSIRENAKLRRSDRSSPDRTSPRKPPRRDRLPGRELVKWPASALRCVSDLRPQGPGISTPQARKSSSSPWIWRVFGMLSPY